MSPFLSITRMKNEARTASFDESCFVDRHKYEETILSFTVRGNRCGGD
jgi:hypothetical protein